MASERMYVSKADIRKNLRRMRNGPGRNQSLGGRVENSKGFSPNSFDRVLLDAPCSALGLRPRLFAGEVSSMDGMVNYICLFTCISVYLPAYRPPAVHAYMHMSIGKGDPITNKFTIK